MPPPPPAGPLGHVAILIVGHIVQNLNSVIHLAAALHKQASRVDVHLCVATQTAIPMGPAAGPAAASVLRFSSGLDQFQRAHACYVALTNGSASHASYDWFLRTRPDVEFVANGAVAPALSPRCIHAKLREVKNLAHVTKHTLSYDQCSLNCPGAELAPADRACLDVDDQLTMVPAGLAASFFAFGSYEFAHSRYSSLGECRGLDGPENRLTQWLLYQRFGVCPVGHVSSGFNVRYFLRKYGNYEANLNRAACDRPKYCGLAALEHAAWMAKVRSYPVHVCQHMKLARGPANVQRSDQCARMRKTWQTWSTR